MAIAPSDQSSFNLQASRSAWKKTARATLVSHWHKGFDDFHVSAKEFYATLEQGITKRDLPQIKGLRVVWKEAGLFSAYREYLRIEWRQYIYDLCTAPLGTGCFFSSWMCILPRRLTGWNLLGMALSLFILVLLLVTFVGAILFGIGLFILANLLRNGKIQVDQGFEEFLCGLTILIPIIDVYFRPATYFEIDTAEMFHGLIHTALLEAIDNLTDAKGIERIGDLERKPIMRDFFVAR